MTDPLVPDGDNDPSKQQKWSRSQWWKMGFSVPLFVVGSFLLLNLNAGAGSPTESKCIEHMSAWCNVPLKPPVDGLEVAELPAAPALSAVEYEWVTFQNAFSQQSPYRGAPNPQIEAEWERLYQYGPFDMAAKQRERGGSGNGVDDLTSADGSTSTAGNLLVYHQIYCLNLLRQHTYRSEYNYSGLPSFAGPEERVMEHANRCIETLRKTLMCAGDTTPYLIMLTPERPGGESPDFNTLHGCRKMDRVRRWSEENALMPGGGEMDGYMFANSVY